MFSSRGFREGWWCGIFVLNISFLFNGHLLNLGVRGDSLLRIRKNELILIPSWERTEKQAGGIWEHMI